MVESGEGGTSTGYNDIETNCQGSHFLHVNCSLPGITTSLQTSISSHHLEVKKLTDSWQK